MSINDPIKNQNVNPPKIIDPGIKILSVMKMESTTITRSTFENKISENVGRSPVFLIILGIRSYIWRLFVIVPIY
jgi:hypothetical protein